MNYYDHHIGDYATAVQYHSWDQDMAYTRMIRWYYAKEKPLPVDPEEVCRLIGAQTDLQREAVTVVLRDFFKLEADGWHNARCDEVIAAYHAGEPERVQKKKNEDTRVERHRRERAELFAVLNGAGEHLPWNVGIVELRAAVKRIQEAGPRTAPETGGVTGSVSGAQNSVSGGVTGVGAGNDGFSSENTDDRKPATQPVTATATPATATHTPLPSTHTPVVLIQEPNGSLSTSGKPTVAELQKVIDGIPSGLTEKVPACPHDKMLALWKQVLPEAIQHTSWSGTRMTHLRTRWRETAVKKGWEKEEDGLLYFKKLFFFLRKSPFLMGQVPPKPGFRQFELKLSWLVNAANWAKVHDGEYHEKSKE